MKKRIIYLILVLFTIPLLTQGSNPPIIKWKVNHPFEQKVVIENKGQYNIPGKVASKDILYGARQGGFQYYFTTNSIWIKRSVAIKRTEQEIEVLKVQNKSRDKEEDEDDKELDYKQVDEFHEISFKGINPSVEITSDNEVNWYYNFTIKGSIPVKAHAFKRLIYHNLYPGIDMEFYFPEDKEGFEYSFIVHPGADVAQIKIQYPLNEATKLTRNNNIVVQSPYGNFTDHTPVVSQQGEIIGCSVSLKNNAIAEFSINGYDKTKTLVIDPWVTVPTFTGTNSAYDVDWDNAGNCYIYGGSSPWQLVKYNSSGAMLWSYTESFDTLSLGVAYGDFAVDRNSQSVYIIQGAGSASTSGYGNAEIQKINSSGSFVKTWGGDPNFNELWRITTNSCTNQIVVVGGGTSSPTYTGCYLDTTLTHETGVNILNSQSCCDDIWGIVLDNEGKYAYLGAINDLNNNTLNGLLKIGIPSLSPVTWNVADGYSFAEKCCSTFGYAYGVGWGHVGYDGITLSNTNLYTYDSHTLKQWNTLNGNLTNGKIINSIDTNAINWGGLTADQCDNIFLGDSTNIQQYDGNLNLVNTITGTNTIYDVVLASNNILYACGDDFVEAVPVSLPNCYFFNVQNQINNPTCLNPASGSDTLVLTNGVPPYTTTWNTTPVQKGDTVSNLSAGTYVAMITDMSCPPDTVFDTITLHKFINIIGGNNFSVCSGNSVSLTVTDTIGKATYSWSPSSGLNSTSDSSVIANPTVTTTYTVIATILSGCSDTAQIVVKVNPLPAVNVTPGIDTICSGQSTSITASGAYTYTWSPSTGLNATSGLSVTVSPTTTTTYTITGTDNNGCKNFTTLNINVVTISASSPPPICSGQGVLLTVSGMDSYKWYPATGLSTTTGDSVVAKPVSNTTYTVTGSTNECSNQALQVIVTVNPLPVIQVTPAIPSICLGQSINWNASGAESYTWSPATGLSSTTGANVTLNPTNTTTYSITGTDSIGCSDTITSVAYVDSLPTASFVINPPSLCNSQQIQFTNTSTGASTYLWDFGDGTTDNSANPIHNYSKGGLYTIKLTASTANGCSDSTTGTDSIKSVNYGVHIANAFAPGSGDGANNIFKPEQILCSENQNYLFRIYSRWGELIYETNDPNQGWDGTYKGKMEPIDVYVYYIQYNCGTCTQFIKGNVTLLK